MSGFWSWLQTLCVFSLIKIPRSSWYSGQSYIGCKRSESKQFNSSHRQTQGLLASLLAESRRAQRTEHLFICRVILGGAAALLDCLHLPSAKWRVMVPASFQWFLKAESLGSLFQCLLLRFFMDQHHRADLGACWEYRFPVHCKPVWKPPF